jgi:eukaryotic-like serine/threonine-protein kinase
MINKTLGHYRVGEQLGRGGMGEVYLADDLNLNRKVALKFLPDVFTGDPERMARFEREAKLLASLNHPNIAAIYGLEQAEGKRFIIMELVEGESLAQRLSKGPLPVEEALGVCRQIAEGLEAAHEKGVIHRDLKPANVMITEGDKVKILDFGLAKALSDEAQSVDSSQSPTLTEAMTRPGVILGTAAYMSPEQAKGKAVDKRADIWAFGCILYECLTGKRVFEGETVTETLAAVLKNEPEWEALPSATPPKIRFVLRRCLEKNMSQRFGDAAAVRIIIEEAHDIGEADSRMKRKWLWVAYSGAALFFLAALALVFVIFREKAPSSAEPIRFQIVLPDKVSIGSIGGFALSPNGRHLAFIAAGSDGVRRLWIRSLYSLEVRPLKGTELEFDNPPFWSPNSRYIAFDSGGKLKKIDIIGGPPQTICNLTGRVIGGSWNFDDVIIFGDYTASNGIMRVSAAGGAALPVTKPNPERQESNHVLPTFLPDGRHFLYVCNSDDSESAGVYIGSLDVRPDEQRAKRLMATTWMAALLSPMNSATGQLLFAREQTLMAQPFDEKRLELIGDAITVADQIGYYRNISYFSASTNGVLIYRGSSLQRSQLSWFDRQGKIFDKEAQRGRFGGLALSPDSSRAAVSWDSTSQTIPSPHIWLFDFARGTNTHFTFSASREHNPIWSPDGSHIIFAALDSYDVSNIYQKLASGIKNEELLLKSSAQKSPTSMSRDERFLLYTMRDPKTKDDVWVHPMERNGKGSPFLHAEFNELDGHFSPTGHWVAYVSDESGNDEIYVCGFSQVSTGTTPEPSGKWQISKGGGTEPRWRGDSKELYYRASDGRVMAVEVAAGTVFQTTTPKPLFQAPLDTSTLAATIRLSTWDVVADGNRFLIQTPVTESSPTPFTVVLNWTALFRK